MFTGAVQFPHGGPANAVPPAPTFVTSALHWHAHEMLYGFGWAALGGFLLTASKNWVGVRGYLCIVAQLIVAGLGAFVALPWIGSLAVHLFTVGVMGLILPAMIVRISKGHTGSNVVFEPADKLVLWIMIAGLVIRVAAPQLYPAGYLMWLHLSATCWFAAFSLLAWRYLPFLFAPRVDGKLH